MHHAGHVQERDTHLRRSPVEQRDVPPSRALTRGWYAPPGMGRLVLISLGGALGTAGRHPLFVGAPRPPGPALPYGALAANGSGSLLPCPPLQGGPATTLLFPPPPPVVRPR